MLELHFLYYHQKHHWRLIVVLTLLFGKLVSNNSHFHKHVLLYNQSLYFFLFNKSWLQENGRSSNTLKLGITIIFTKLDIGLYKIELQRNMCILNLLLKKFVFSNLLRRLSIFLRTAKNLKSIKCFHSLVMLLNVSHLNQCIDLNY